MKHIRHFIPVLGFLALFVLFFKLPETPNLFATFGCKTCTSADPYLPLIGTGYFAMLIALSFLFPAFPNRLVARAGLIWALLLTFALTYISAGWCTACLICHGCNILIWTIWFFDGSKKATAPTTAFRERLCLTIFAPFSIVALFSCLNLTFMAYDFKISNSNLPTSLKLGDALPDVATYIKKATPYSENYILNFVSPNCPYCKEQLPIMHTIANQFCKNPYHFINISPELTSDLIQLSPDVEWIEDKNDQLRELFKVKGYPVVFLLDSNYKIIEIIPGVPDDLKTNLLTHLPHKPHEHKN